MANNSKEVSTFLFHPDCLVFQVDHLPGNTCLGVTSDFWIGVNRVPSRRQDSQDPVE